MNDINWKELAEEWIDVLTTTVLANQETKDEEIKRVLVPFLKVAQKTLVACYGEDV